jgi:hypothetical protein
MDSLPTEIIQETMSHLAIDDGAKFSWTRSNGLELMMRRKDPVLYLSKTFKYARSLFAAVGDEGCVISGSMAQEFMLPGSVGDNSDWDIYVPGNVKSVTNMLSVLSECGVEWKWLGDDLNELISGGEGTTKVLCTRHLNNIEHWVSPTSTTYFSKLHHTRERIKAARNIIYSYRQSAVPEDQFDQSEPALDGFIQVTKTSDGYAVQKVASPSAFDLDLNGEIDSGSMIPRPAVINGVVTRGERRERVQLIVCQVFGRESRPLSLITNFYASHTQCFITGWCAVHLYYSLAKEKKSILWAKDPDTAVKAAIAKYKARGYEFIPPPDPELAFPRERISTTSKGALMVPFDTLYEEITGFAPNFKGEIEQYLQCRKAGLADISWFMGDDRKLVMNIYGDLKSLRKKEPDDKTALARESKYSSFRMFRHLASHAPQEVSGILRDPGQVDYDNPFSNKFTQALITSGVAAMNATGNWSFIL